MQMKRKIRLMVVVELVCLLALGAFLFMMQTALSVNSQRDAIAEKLAQIPELVARADEEENQVYISYDEVYQAKAETLAYMIRTFDDFAETEPKTADMEEMRAQLNITNALIVDRDGKVLAKADNTPADFTGARFNRLSEVFYGKTPEPFGVGYAGGTRSYFAARIDSERMAVIEQDPTELDELAETCAGWASMLGNVYIGMNGYAFAVSAKDYTFAYHPDDALNGHDALAAGVNAEMLRDGSYGWLTLDGQRMYCGVTQQGGNYIICAVPESDIMSARNVTVAIILFVFAAVLTLIITYALLLVKEEHDTGRFGGKTKELFGRLKLDELVAGKLVPVAVLGLGAILLISVYMQTLYALSQASMGNEQRAAEVESTISRYEEQGELVLAQYNRRYLNKAQTAAYILGRQPDLATPEDLATLSEVLDVEHISVFNSSGVITVTNSDYLGFHLSNTPGEQSYEFRKMLNGASYVVQTAQADELSGEVHQYIAASLPGGSTVGSFVQISVEPSRLENNLAGVGIASVLQNVKVGAHGFAFAVDKETHEFSYHPTEKLIGRDALSYGLQESELRDDFSDYLTVNGERLYGSVLETERNYVFVVLPAREVASDCWPAIVMTGIVGLICLALVVILLSLTTYTQADEAGESTAAPSDNDATVEIKMPDGSVKETVSAAHRWDGFVPDWSDLSPEKKTLAVARGFIAVLSVLVCVAVMLPDQFLGQDSIFHYVLRGSWQRGLNIFACTSALAYLCVIQVIAMAAREVLRIAAKNADARGETVFRLLRSCVKYVSFIAMLYFCLAQFGVDTQTLLASAGILSLVIGLGAQKLVQDVVAGLFLIFEGEFRVGDIVTVGSWRGTVREIGIRTTKIEDGQHNVKILNNSEVSGLVNMTKNTSYAMIDASIEYGESLERVENILAKELPNIKRRLPAIRSGPFYKGVTELGENSVNIRIMAECAESDRFQLVRDLNREIKLMFDRNDISIPFPQIVINQPTEFKKATFAEKIKADAFAKEQAESSKALHDENGDK